MPTALPIVTVVIVNWNTRDYLKRCLDSVFSKNHVIPFDVIVVDNNSSDGSVEMVRNEFSQVTLIENQENLGFSRANNQAMRLSRSRYYLLLNSDTELRTGEPLEKLLEYLDQNPKTGILGGRLVFPDGTLQVSGRKFISLWSLIKTQLFFLNSPYLLRLLPRSLPEMPFETDFVAGAFFFIRREIVEQVGAMDEAFFLFGEDMEWCFRAGKAGWKVAVLPQIEVVHHHSVSVAQDLPMALENGLLNTCKVMNALFGKTQARLAYYIYSLGMFLRVLLHFFPNRDKAAGYWQALRRSSVLSITD